MSALPHPINYESHFTFRPLLQCSFLSLGVYNTRTGFAKRARAIGKKSRGDRRREPPLKVRVKIYIHEYVHQTFLALDGGAGDPVFREADI